MIVARHITKSFGDVKVLNGVDLHIPKGCIYGLAGRSGVGKSTLLRCINGLEPYDEGQLLVDGVDVKRLRKNDLRAFRKNVGMIFQNFSLLERLSVHDNVALPLKCWKHNTSHVGRKVRELVDLVGLSEKIRQKPRELSGGQKQRVAIARALSLEPQILLCDEATSALDPKTAQDILGLLGRINRELNITIIMVTHQMSILIHACNQVAIIENGRIDSHGSVSEIFERKPHALKNLLGENGCPSARPSAPSQNVTLSLVCRSDTMVADLVDHLGIDATLVGKKANPIPSAAPGERRIRIDENDLERVAGFLNDRAVKWRIEPEHETGSALVN